MNIWLLNHYAVPPQYYPLARPANFAKFLMMAGHEVTIFAAATVHNSDVNLIDDGKSYREDTVDGVHYVYVRDIAYRGNGIRRIANMFLFPMQLPGVCRRFPKPDVILSTSVTPMVCRTGTRLAKKYGCPSVLEIADLWPESFVAYGMLKKGNPLLRPMYRYEKRMYAEADAIVFTMEGGRDYILEKGWDKAHGGPVDTERIFHINNGVDLAQFDENREKRVLDDPELDVQDVVKVVYAGSMRQVNDISALLGAAELLHEKRPDIRFLLYGDGDMRPVYEKRCEEKGLDNVSFRGLVGKEQIPSVLSRADVCFVDGCEDEAISRFGMSPNKLFEYLASGRPIIFPIQGRYDLVGTKGCGYTTDNTPAAVAEAIESLADDAPARETMGAAARKTAEDYDFRVLTQRLEAIFEKVTQP